MPRRRDRRRLDESRSEMIDRPRIVEKSGCAKNENGGHKRKFKLFQIEIGIGLFVGAFAFGNILAKLARMFAVERLSQRLSQGSVMRIADDHLRPGEGLKERPMHADGRGERQYEQQFGQP